MAKKMVFTLIMCVLAILAFAVNTDAGLTSHAVGGPPAAYYQYNSVVQYTTDGGASWSGAVNWSTAYSAVSSSEDADMYQIRVVQNFGFDSSQMMVLLDSGAFTLNLNGRTIDTGSRFIYINGADVTLIGEGGGQINCSQYILVSGSKLTMLSGTINISRNDSIGTFMNISSGGHFELIGGFYNTTTGEGESNPSSKAISIGGSGNLTISGGYIHNYWDSSNTDDITFFSITSGANVNITGGYFKLGYTLDGESKFFNKTGLDGKYGSDEYCFAKEPVAEEGQYAFYYEIIDKNYNITFIVEGEESIVNGIYGSMPVFSGTPSKAATATRVYTFSGWSPALAEVEGEATYTAQFSEDIRSYNITFSVNGVESIVSTEYGVMPVFGGTPSKATTAAYTYTFSGWSPALAEVEGEATYTAQFDESVNTYEIIFVIDGDEVKLNVPFGNAPIPPENPQKTGHTFIGWSSELVDVSGAATYTALWEKNGLSAGAIAGIVLGSTAFAGIIVFLIIIFIKRKDKRTIYSNKEELE